MLDDINLMGGSNGELQVLTNRLVERAVAYELEVSTEKSKIMTNSTNNISTDINMNSQKLEEVTSCDYLGATLWKDGTCSAEVSISHGQRKQDLAVQHRPLCKQVQAVQVSCHLLDG